MCLLLVQSAQVRAQFSGFDEQLAADPSLSLDFSVVLSRTSAEPGDTVSAAVVVTMESPWHINSARPYEEWLIPARVRFDNPDGLRGHSVAYPDGHDYQMGDLTLSVYSDRVVIPFQVTVETSTAPGDYILPIRFRYQPCNDKECLPPQTAELNLTVPVGASGEPTHADIFAGDESVPQSADTTMASNGTASNTARQDEGELQHLIDEYGFWGYFLALGLAFITGLLLSFSPCTYPMIPITVSIFAGQQRSLGRGFVLSLFYVGSMAVVYGIMGLIVSLVGGVFGAWLAKPEVVIAIAVVFVIFALSMFGLYELQVPAALRNKLGAKASGGGVIGALVLGIVAALVVSPCVGPFVAGILLYIATAGSPLIGFLVLFVFAIGLGTLYLIIGTFSSAINALPNSGAWMETVKKFFGFVLLLMAVYFLRTIVPAVVTAIVTGLILLAFGVFGGGLDRLTPESGGFARLKKLLGIIALLLGLYLLGGTVLREGFILPSASSWLPLGGGTASTEREPGLPWQTDLEASLAQAKAEGKPVIIDTWATWCANCRVLEARTFRHPDVIVEGQRFIPIKVQLERADDVATKDFMQRFDLPNYTLPTTLLLDSSGKVRRILRGVVGPGEMIEEMKKVR